MGQKTNDVTVSANSGAEALLKCLCRHFVSLQGTYVLFDEAGRQRVDETFFAYSGFVIAIEDVWWFVTAGHVLKELHERSQNRQVRIKYLSLFDGFHDAPHEGGIPFSLDGAGQWWIDNDDWGLDAGVILLSPCYRAPLEANGVVPITPGCWEGIEEIQFDAYAVLGLPDHFLEKKPTIGVRGERVIGGGRAVLTFLTSSDAQPREKPIPRLPWFVGSLKASEAELKNMVGMSGGPVFCLKNRQGQPPLYGVVAIQSWWDKERRLALATRLPVFLSALADHLVEKLAVCE
jgi:hypothetical protein